MTNRALGLLLLPLVPLSALGIVSLVDRALPTEPTVIECRSIEAPRAAPQLSPEPPPQPTAPLAEGTA